MFEGLGIVTEVMDGYPGDLEPWYEDMKHVPCACVFWFDIRKQLLSPQDELLQVTAQGYSRVIQN